MSYKLKGEYSIKANSVFVSGCKHGYFCCKVLIWESMGTDQLLEPLLDVKGTAAFGTSMLGLLFRPMCCPLSVKMTSNEFLLREKVFLQLKYRE